MKKLTSTLIITLIGLNLLAVTPDWQVNSNDFQYSMEVYATILYQSNVLDDENDKLAVFVGDECRGVATPVDNSITGEKMYFLVAYANTNSEEMCFKLYDSSTDQVLNLLNTEVFTANTAFGSISKAYIASDEKIATVEDVESTSQGLVIKTLNTGGLYRLVATSEIKSYAVYDTAGKLLLNKKSKQSELDLDLSSYATNVYLVRVETEMGTMTTKLLSAN